MNKLLIEIDGPDGSGKTTLADALAVRCARRSVTCIAAPAAKALVSRFDRFNSLSAREQLALEVDGYAARLAWATTVAAAVVVLDRGMATLVASSRARLASGGGGADLDEGALHEPFVRAARPWRARRTILLGTSAVASASWMELFRTREREVVGPEYARYQARLVASLRATEGAYPGAVIDACLAPTAVADRAEAWLFEHLASGSTK